MFDLSEIFLTSIRKDSMPPSKMSISAAVLSLSVPPGEDLVPEPAEQVEAATGGGPGGRQSTGRRQVKHCGTTLLGDTLLRDTLLRDTLLGTLLEHKNQNHNLCSIY